MIRQMFLRIAILLLTCSTSYTAPAYSQQQYQVRAGIDFSTLSHPLMDFGYHTGIHVAVAREFPLPRLLSLQVELEYTNHGYTDEQVQSDAAGNETGIVEARTGLHYLSVPVLGLLRFSRRESIVPYLLIGPQFELLVYRNPGIWRFETISEDNPPSTVIMTMEDPLAELLKDSSISLSLGIGCMIANIFNREFRIEARQSFGLTNHAAKSSGWRISTRSLAFSISTDF